MKVTLRERAGFRYEGNSAQLTAANRQDRPGHADDLVTPLSKFRRQDTLLIRYELPRMVPPRGCRPRKRVAFGSQFRAEGVAKYRQVARPVSPCGVICRGAVGRPTRGGTVGMRADTDVRVEILEMPLPGYWRGPSCA